MEKIGKKHEISYNKHENKVNAWAYYWETFERNGNNNREKLWTDMK